MNNTIEAKTLDSKLSPVNTLQVSYRRVVLSLAQHVSPACYQCRKKPGAVLSLVGLTLSLMLTTTVHAMDNYPTVDCLVEPNQTVELSTAVTGVVANVTVDRGDYVSRGQVIARLDSGVESAFVDLAKSRAQFDGDIALRRENQAYVHRNQERLLALYQQEAVSDQRLDEIDTEMRLAKLELEKSEQQQRINQLEHVHALESLARRTIVSPIDGVVVKRFLSTGEYVENRPIISITEINPLRVEVFAPISLLGRINIGDRASIQLEVGDRQDLQAIVTMVDKVVDAASGTFGIYLQLPNSDNKISGGLRCQASFQQNAIGSSGVNAAADAS
ncbi:MAG: RND family efflux transporter MFP subunit [Paraglaciecola psychrophila]|jgi:RND family efflux transporter MFP subunit